MPSILPVGLGSKSELNDGNRFGLFRRMARGRNARKTTGTEVPTASIAPSPRQRPPPASPRSHCLRPDRKDASLSLVRRLDVSDLSLLSLRVVAAASVNRMRLMNNRKRTWNNRRSVKARKSEQW